MAAFGAGTSGGSLFKTPASSAPTAGFSFGTTTQTNAAPTGGFAFGGTQTSTAPTGFSFGNTQASAAPAFGFGSTQTSTAPAFGFGTAQTTAAAPSFGFGAAQPTTVQPTFGFGATQTTAAQPTFGFGAPQTSTGPNFGFGTQQPTAAAQPFGFGTQQATSAPSTGFTFGAASSSAPTLVGQGFGFGTAPPASTGLSFGTSGGGFTGFGTTAATSAPNAFGGFGTSFGSSMPNQQPQAASIPGGISAGTALESVFSSVLYCNVYGDERDAILARWNVLQAAWGTGKGYFSGTATPVQYTTENSLCRFKTTGYCKLPQGKNEDGIVVVLLNKPEDDVRRDQHQLVSTINVALGSKPNLNVVVEGLTALDNNKTEVLICVQERSATGAVHKAPALDLASFLWQQPAARAQLTTLGVASCVAKIRPTSEQLREYLASPPAGIDVRLWKQAKAENPDPKNYVPVPLIGFDELVRHLHLQEKVTKRHQASLDGLAEEITGLQKGAAETAATVNEYRRRQIDLQLRVFQLLIKLECARKAGLSLQPDEERLRVHLESIHNELGIPTQFRGRLNELLSQVRMRQTSFTPAGKNAERYSIDPAVLDNLKQVLKAQQEGMAQLMNIMKEDFHDIHILENALRC